MSILLAAPVTLLAFTICALAQIATTSVTDTIYRASGTPAGGTVIVSWPAFTTPSGQSIGAGNSSAVIGAGGLLNVPLTPNAGAMPLGTYYTVVYHLDDGSVNREYWVVPASASPVHISAIRSTVLPTSVAMQTVSKSYVDTAIAAAVAGHPLDTSNPYVLKAGDTMSGPLVLAGDPTAAPQAATKNYVDTSINAVVASQLHVFGASGASHAAGVVPDPGATAGTTRYLREDGTWATPVGGGTTGASVNVPQGATADYDFMQGAGTVLTDKSGNGNNGALGTGAAAPNWVSTGLHFPAGSNVALPSALNNTRTVVAAVYLDPLLNSPANPQWPALMSSSMGASGLNLMLFYSIGGDNYSMVFSPSVWSSGGSTTVGDARLSGFHIVSYVTGSSTDSTVDHLYIDGSEVGGYRTQGSSAGAQSSGNLFLGASGAGYWTGGASETMYRVLTYASALTPEQVRSATAAVRAGLVARGVAVSPQITRPIAPQLHAIGDSITFGAGVSNPWPSLLSLTNQPAYNVRNWGIGGIKAIEINGTETNRAALSCKTSAGASSVAIVMLGTNDFGFGTRSAEEVFREIAGEVGTLKDAGCTVFVGTILSRPGTDANGNTGDVNKDNLDNIILQRAKLAGAVGVIDFAANPLLGADGANAGAAFQADHLHPTQAGQQMMATAASNTLNYYFGYTLTNANAVAASTYTLASGDGVVTAAITANAAWTMPDCTGPSGAEYTITNPQSAYTLSIVGQANQPINGLTTPVAVPANSTITLHDVPNPKNVSGCHWVM